MWLSKGDFFLQCLAQVALQNYRKGRRNYQSPVYLSGDEEGGGARMWLGCCCGGGGGGERGT